MSSNAAKAYDEPRGCGFGSDFGRNAELQRSKGLLC